MREISRTYGLEVLLIVAGFVLIPAGAVAAGRLDAPGPGIVIPLVFVAGMGLVYMGVRRALQKRGDENTLSGEEIRDFAEEPEPGEDLVEEPPSEPIRE